MTSAGKFHIIDEVSLFAVTESLALRGEVDTNVIAWTQWVNSPGEVLGAFGEDGEVYSKKGPAPAFLAVPWYLLLRLIGRLDIAALACCRHVALEWRCDGADGRAALADRWRGWAIATARAWLLGLLFGLATIAWPYANHFFGEPLSAFSLLLSSMASLSLARRSDAWTLDGAGGHRRGDRHCDGDRARAADRHLRRLRAGWLAADASWRDIADSRWHAGPPAAQRQRSVIGLVVVCRAHRSSPAACCSGTTGALWQPVRHRLSL